MQHFKKPDVYLRKTKCVPILLTGFMQIICKNFFAKLVQPVSLCHKAFQKAKNYQNLTTESGLRQRFSLFQEMLVIQAVCLRTRAVSIKARFMT